MSQDRQDRFRTEVFERYHRSEKALVTTLNEMPLQGISTRKVNAVTEGLCRHGFSSLQQVDEQLSESARRQLEDLILATSECAMGKAALRSGGEVGQLGDPSSGKICC